MVEPKEKEHQPRELVPNRVPDHVYFEGRAVSWDTSSQDGWDARLGVIQPGFNETFDTPPTGERIWLNRPVGNRALIVHVLSDEGDVASTHTLIGEGAMVHVTGGANINVVTPEGQGDISYMCDYPGIMPGEGL